MSRPIRLTIVMTHPVQYYSPWFRYITAKADGIDLTVLYATEPTPSQQGVGFDRAFTWDVPLTDGYRCRIMRPPRPGESVHSDVFWGIDVPEIGEALLDSKPDVALVGGWYSITLLRALWACRRRRIPVLYRGDTHLGSAPTGWRWPAWALKTWSLLRCFDGYLSVGRRTRAYLRRFGVPDSRIFAAPHCVDNDHFAHSAARHQTPESRATARTFFGLPVDDFVVLFVGKLEPKKRPQDVIRAVAQLGSETSLLVVGAGPLESVCREEAQALGVRASWAGFLNQSQIGQAYAAADCLTLPSDWGETWGLVVNEAMATGLPCVVSDRVGCARDLVIAGETGDVSPFGDTSALAAALKRLGESREAGRDFAAACRTRVSGYSHEAATVGLVAACQDTLQRHARASAPERRRATRRVIACCGHMSMVSGLELMTFEVLRALRAQGTVIHCILNTWANWDKPQEKHPIAVLAERIGASWATGYYWYGFERRSRNPLKVAQLMWDTLRTSGGLLWEAWHFRPSHVFMPDYLAVLRNAPALTLLRLVGCQVILRLGNAPEPGSFYRRVWRHGVNPFVDRFICNSRFTQTELEAHGIPASKVSQIYNCAPSRREPGLTDIARDAYRIIYVGQIIPAKGVDLVLDAVGIVGRGYDVGLDVVGDMEGWASPSLMPYREAIVARAGQPDLVGRVQFIGWREDVPALLARASILCCPSRPELREGFGVVVVEAKLAGVPSVVCPSGALPELVEHGEDGWVASEVSADALAEGIEYFLKDATRLLRARQAARRSAARFSRDKFAEAWWAVFHDRRGKCIPAEARSGPSRNHRGGCE